MSIMGLFHTSQINNQTQRKKNLIIAFASALFVLFLALTQSATVSAADASWVSADQKSISYQGKTFSGPNHNKDASGWSPSNDSQRDAIYYSYKAPGSGMFDSEVLWFPKDTNLKTVGSVNYSVLEKSMWGDFSGIKSNSTIQISLGSSVSAPGAAASAMKAVFKSSIGSYVNSQCNNRFTDQAQRNECINNTNTAFDTCWNIQAGSISFATSMNPESPADSINTENLAFCIASDSGTGRATAYAQALKGAVDEANTKGASAFKEATPDGTVADQPTTCAITGIGWIVCPISNALASVTDNVFDLISGLLEVKVFSNTTSNGSLKNAWGTMLSFANIAFVIAFLIIIYSQLTGAGITNYTMKRMLPRLVVAAILVNISFWICAIAVDISNILGYSLQNIFMALSEGLPQNQSIPTWEAVTINIMSGGAITAGIVGAGLAITSPALMWGMLGVLWPLLIGAVFSVLIAIIILTIRQALVVILIVISPLAFVAFLLPNTQKWFTKWRDLLTTMLLLFPAISLIFGGSQYAAKVIMSTSPQGAVVLMALAIQVLPLAITPMILKLSGGLMSRIGGMINNPTKGPFDRLKNAGSKGIEERKDLATKRNLAGRSVFSSLPGSRVQQWRQRRRRGRELAGKDFEGVFGSNTEAAYLDTEKGARNRADAANAQVRASISQANVESGRLQTDAARALNSALSEANIGKQISEEVQKQQAIVDVPVDLQIRAKAASAQTSAQEADMNQLFEEIKVNNPDSSAPKHALYNQVSAATQTVAQDALRASDIANSATNSAKRVQQLEYADAIESSARRASAAGGIDPYGAQRAKSQATVMQDKAIDEAVSNEKATMGAIGENEIAAAQAKYPALAAKAASGANVSANDVLASFRDDSSLSMERRIAAQSKLVDAANAKDMVNYANDLSSMLNSANASLATAKASGDPVAIAKAQAEVTTAIHLQKQLFSDGVSKLPTSVTGPTKGALANGSYTGNMDSEVLSKLQSGAYSGAGLASMSAHEVKWVASVIEANKSNPAYATMGAKLRDDIMQHRAASVSLGKTVAPEIGDAMEKIRISF